MEGYIENHWNADLRSQCDYNYIYTCSPSQEDLPTPLISLKKENNFMQKNIDAQKIVNNLYEIDFDDGEVNLIEAMKTLQDALVFVLETMDWKIGN